MLRRAGLLLVTVWQLACAPDPPPSIVDGVVVGVTDGDTLTIREANWQETIVRLADVDTPERGQHYYLNAKRALAGRVLRRAVTVEILDRDRYGRAVGIVRSGGENVNAWMVAGGHARVYRKYLRDPALLDLETSARESGKGLWSAASADSSSTSICRIKGNINRHGKRIYHMPGSLAYDDTVVDESRGERWFCSEKEAVAAGWQPVRQILQR